MKSESPHFTDKRVGYSLEFLKGPDADFTRKMLEYIQIHFAELLDQEDLELLARGDSRSLEFLSKKVQAALKGPLKPNEPMSH